MYMSLPNPLPGATAVCHKEIHFSNNFNALAWSQRQGKLNRSQKKYHDEVMKHCLYEYHQHGF